jgi:hypothetical protein
VSTGEQQDYDHDNIYHYIISFVCNFIDSKGSPYDIDRTTYFYKTPPTDVDIVKTVGTNPVFNDINQPYKIPQ